MTNLYDQSKIGFTLINGGHPTELGENCSWPTCKIKRETEGKTLLLLKFNIVMFSRDRLSKYRSRITNSDTKENDSNWFSLQ